MIDIYILFSSIIFGIFLIVQFVIYPSFLHVTEKKLAEFERIHRKQMTYFITPFFTIEFVLGIVLVFSEVRILIPFLLSLIVYAKSVFWYLPLHVKIEKFSKESDVYLLIRSNWVRVILSGIKVVLLVISF